MKVTLRKGIEDVLGCLMHKTGIYLVDMIAAPSQNNLFCYNQAVFWLMITVFLFVI